MGLAEAVRHDMRMYFITIDTIRVIQSCHTMDQLFHASKWLDRIIEQNHMHFGSYRQQMEEAMRTAAARIRSPKCK